MAAALVMAMRRRIEGAVVVPAPVPSPSLVLVLVIFAADLLPAGSAPV